MQNRKEPGDVVRYNEDEDDEDDEELFHSLDPNVEYTDNLANLKAKLFQVESEKSQIEEKFESVERQLDVKVQTRGEDPQ